MNRLLLARVCILTLMCFLFTNTIFGQKNPQQAKDRLKADLTVKNFVVSDKLGTPSFISFSEKTTYKADEAAKVVQKYFELEGAGNEIRSVQKNELHAGVQVERMKLYYQGIPVEHSSYVVTSRSNRIISVNAESYSLNNISIVPVLAKDAALQKALQFVNAEKYAWDALEEDKAKASGNPAFQQKLENLRREFFPEGELVIAKDVYGSGQPRLAWKFNIYATQPLSRSYIYIDAIDGKLLLRDMIIKHAGSNNTDPVQNTTTGVNKFQQASGGEPFRLTASESGIAHTRYAGIRDIYTTRVSVPLAGTPDPNNSAVLLSYSGADPRTPILAAEDVFILKDDTRGKGIETYDMNGVGGLPLSLPGLQAQSLAFVDRNVTVGSQNIWKNEAAGITNEDLVRGTTSDGTLGTDEAFNDDIALDAHWGAEMVYDYWKTVHGRLSFDNNNSAIKSYVHYGPAYDNAFWNGTVMTYGDGSGTTAAGFKPLTSLDVCGHEIGHGICSFTSDLVYESESGAMNEALSDIWAASIERYVIVNIDPTLSAVYRPFFIGEQIAADPNDPLRRMDAPKEQGNPDTYGGENWVNPVCTPTLVNDECGVHTNSGVLNKWYYLLTAGSGDGSGPDASFVLPGADDELRDAVGVPDGGGSYSVTGIGFSRSEGITYLMEMMLTPNATYADARTASINAARILYGECSVEEVSVTNAWYAVGVGDAYTTCTLPDISASTLQTDVRETAAGTDCIRYTEYNINVNLTVVQGSDVTVNFTIGATTMSPDEYALSASSVTYAAGETGLRTVKLRIYDDAMVEGDETVDVNVTTATPALNETFTFTVRNDDLDPTIGGTQTLLDENFESTATNTVPAGWSLINVIDPSPVKWEVETYVAGALTWSGKRAIIELEATSPVTDGIAVYDVTPVATEAQTILKTPLIDATGLNNVRVQFVYNAGGEPACDPACDYGQLVYSYDGTNFVPFTDGATSMYVQLTDADYDYVLPASFNGKQFYLGILWNNDANAGTAASITIDDFVVTARGRDIETELGDGVSEKVNEETGQPTYFYSTTDGDIIARIVNDAPHDYGCVTASIEKAGNGTFLFYTDNSSNNIVSDKVIRITAANNDPSGAYDITLYFTEAQIAALEAYTSMPRTNFSIYKTEAASYTDATLLNTESAPATYTDIPGFGGSFSASFTTGFSGFAVGAAVSFPLPVTCVDFKASKLTNAVHLQWKIADAVNNARFNVERSTNGINYTVIASINANAGINDVYSFDDNNIPAGGNVFYRLRQFDIDGDSKYICTVLKVPFGAGNEFFIGNIYPNPGVREALVNVFSNKALRLQVEYINTAGQIVNRQVEQLQAGTTRVRLNLNNGVPGTYLVRFRNDNGELLGTQTYVRQ